MIRHEVYIVTVEEIFLDNIRILENTDDERRNFQISKAASDEHRTNCIEM